MKRSTPVIDDSCVDAAREWVRRGRQQVPGVISTNLSLHAANFDAAERRSACGLLRSIGNGRDPRYLTDGARHEVMRVQTHAEVLPRSLGWRDEFAFIQVVDPL